MLTKRSRAMPMERAKARQTGDFVSSSSFLFQFAATTQRARTRLLTIPGLFVGFTGKCLPDSDSVSSPTSPLDHRIFSNLAGSFLRSPRSPGRSWDCSRVGLSLVDSLRDDDKTLGRSESKNILLGFQIRSKTPLSTPEVEELGKNDHNPKETCAFASDSKNPHMCSLPSFRGRLEAKCLSGSLPVSIDSIHGFMGVNISASEIELSEDYTCIISHGPNPKTTHIFGEFILENYLKEEERGFNPFPCNDFLSFCSFCKKKLEVGEDIYMYRLVFFDLLHWVFINDLLDCEILNGFQRRESVLQLQLPRSGDTDRRGVGDGECCSRLFFLPRRSIPGRNGALQLKIEGFPGRELKNRSLFQF
ncbi:hypothetical protein AXF42_Ash005318 [Apostasia shenzhenica]|uniref:FLZ-type domain-containing protein n=1 Tax=Apostasia shenzhenica TaxID=1088818 RepID=A0A2I0B6K4_9ASPA|nr:hypothetical protein AXF42_Ash005318 [Apostasia shenzhenica]